MCVCVCVFGMMIIALWKSSQGSILLRMSGLYIYKIIVYGSSISKWMHKHTHSTSKHKQRIAAIFEKKKKTNVTTIATKNTRFWIHRIIGVTESMRESHPGDLHFLSKLSDLKSAPHGKGKHPSTHVVVPQYRQDLAKLSW